MRWCRLVCFLAALCGAQSPQPAGQPLVRLNVDLVQVDAVVTDSQGNHVADLKPEEIEILENGKPQRITNFSYIHEGVPAPLAGLGGSAAAASLVAPARMAPGQAARTIAIVIDDLGIGEQSFAAIHRALEILVDQQVQPGDLVAIVRTSGRYGGLQQLTANKRLLRAALEHFRSIPNHRPGVQDDDFTCVWFHHRWTGQQTGGIQDEDAWLASLTCGFPCHPELDPQQELQNDHRSVYSSLASLGALRRVVDGLRELPGRKSILLFSEGMPLVRGQGTGETNSQVVRAYEAFLTHANRAEVAVNTIDPRGLIGSFAPAERGQSDCEEARRTELVNTRQQLANMARRTGGISISNDNNLPAALGRVWNDQLGYYLIGYKPGAPPRKGEPGAERFRKIAIRTTRPGLEVRFHSDVYAEPEERRAQDGPHRLAAAATSPFAIPNVRVRLASRFWDAAPPAGLVLDTLLEIDAHDLVFRSDGEGNHKASLDILAVIYGTESKPLDTFEKNYTLSMTESGYRRALSEGLVQHLQMSVRRPGPYQIRGAVRDRDSEQIGSASEFIEVPDLTRAGLALSGISLSDRAAASESSETIDRLKYRAGQAVFYAYQILNATAATNGSLQVEVRAALYHDGNSLGASDPVLIDEKGQEDRKRLVVSHNLRLGPQLAPGDYTLQVTALDRNAPQKHATATQAVDFEVIP